MLACRHYSEGKQHRRVNAILLEFRNFQFYQMHISHRTDRQIMTISYINEFNIDFKIVSSNFSMSLTYPQQYAFRPVSKLQGAHLQETISNSNSNGKPRNRVSSIKILRSQNIVVLVMPTQEFGIKKGFQ